MKNPYKVLLLSFALCTALLTGCGSQSPSPSSTSGVESEPSSSASSSAASQPASSKPSASEESDSNAASQVSSGSSAQDETALSDNWVDFNMKLDGVVYKYPFVYQEFDDAGWILEDKTERGLDSGARLLSPRSLKNEKYALEDNKYSCYFNCGFINDTDEFSELVDCGIWLIDFHVSRTISPDSKTASLELAKNIHIGSTEEEIIAAYGPFSEKTTPSNASEDFTDLVYRQQLANDKEAVMTLSLCKGKLFGVNMKLY